MATQFKLTNKARRFMALGLSLAITASCADNDELNNSDETHKLDFGVSLANEWHSPLKTHAANNTQQASSSHFENSDLWLTVSSEPYCDTTLFRAPRTRAATVTTNDFYDSFNVYGYAYKGADWENRTEVTPYFDNEAVTNQNGIWSTDPARYWPGNSYRMHFFAYAPSDMAATLTIEDCAPVKLEYTVPADVKEQKDFVVATDDVAGDHNQSMNLLFEHILTAVKITAAKGMTGTVKKVELFFIRGTGTYSFGNGKWTSPTSIPTRDFEINFAPGQEIHLDPYAEKDTPIVDGENTLMMIPQNLPAGATLIITIADDNGDETEHSAYLYKAGFTSWGEGQCVTYRISKKEPVNVEYEFSATDPDIFTGEGGSNPVEIQSFKTANGANKTPVSWENAGYFSKTESGNFTPLEPDAAYWLQFPVYQAGQTSYNVDVEHQYNSVGRTGEDDRIIIESPDNDLQALSEPDDQTPVNLAAGANGAETTANCYIVNGPGWYKFPIVYGNALKNGSANRAAYNGACFVNHLDKPITAPWIKDNGIKVDNAILLWQDSPENAPFIKDVAVEGDYIKFHIPEGKTCVQGNALIAVKDTAGDIAWSWHIWLTRCEPDDTFQFGNYSFFNALLGYREAELAICPERDVYVKLIQTDSNKEEYVHVSQDHLYQFVAAGNAPYYQHGRKDPFPGASLEVKREEDGKYSVDLLQDKDFRSVFVDEYCTLGTAIMNPDTYIGQADGNSNWYWYGVSNQVNTGLNGTTGYTNLWDNNDVKTVYDPCPAGYKIPTYAALEKVASTDESNVEYVNTGMYFINNKGQENEQRFFLQILCSRGYDRTSNSKISTSSVNANLYCNRSNGSSMGHYLLFRGDLPASYPDKPYWVSHGTVCAGRCVLPQKE